MKSFLIGSLPFANIKEAIDYSFSFSVPSLPSLPKLDQKEFMIDQALENVPYLNFLCASEFFTRLSKGAVYKWQACGPLTLASSLDVQRDEDQILKAYIDKLIKTQERFNVVSGGGESIYFIDEPALAFAGDAGLLYEFIDRLRGSKHFSKTLFGLHACSKVAPLLLANLELDLYSLDMSLYSDEEKKELQVSLGKKLVYAPVGSSGEIYEYPKMFEEYISSTCGQALCPMDNLERIKKRIRGFDGA